MSSNRTACLKPRILILLFIYLALAYSVLASFRMGMSESASLLHAKKDAAEVDVDNPVPLLFSDICCGLEGVFDTGVVEGEVQPAEGFDGRVQRPLYVLAL